MGILSWIYSSCLAKATKDSIVWIYYQNLPIHPLKTILIASKFCRWFVFLNDSYLVSWTFYSWVWEIHRLTFSHKMSSDTLPSSKKIIMVNQLMSIFFFPSNKLMTEIPQTQSCPNRLKFLQPLRVQNWSILL